MVTEYFMLLTLCEKYSINPVEFDEIPDKIKFMMIAKYKVEKELERKAEEKAQKEHNRK
jgi:hypothetical protein